MEQLSLMEQVSRRDKDHFHHNDTESHPRNMTNGISSPSELSDMSTDTTTTMSPFSPKIHCSSPIVPNYAPTTWHPHIYSKPTRVPTAHSITDILNISPHHNQEVDMDEEEQEEDIDPKEEPDQDSLSSPCPSSPLTVPEIMDEPLNLTVKRPISPPSSEANNNKRLINGNGRGILSSRNQTPKKRTKSPINSLLNVIIPKVKIPKISTGPKNGTKFPKTKGTSLRSGTTKRRNVKEIKSLVLGTGVSITTAGENGNSSGGEPFLASGIIEPSSGMMNEDPTSPLSSYQNGSENLKRKKARTTFTGRQIFELERQFEVKKYLSSSERAEMARLLNVTETQIGYASAYPVVWLGFGILFLLPTDRLGLMGTWFVAVIVDRFDPGLEKLVKIWFQNRRTKWKKQDNISNAEAAEHKVQASKSGGKRDKTQGQSTRNKQLDSSASGGGGRKSGLPSECSLSISESVDGDDSSNTGDHSNGSPMTHEDFMSDSGGNSELGGTTDTKRPSTPHVLLHDPSNNTHNNHSSSIISNNSTHQHTPPDSPQSQLEQNPTEENGSPPPPLDDIRNSSPRGTSSPRAPGDAPVLKPGSTSPGSPALSPPPEPMTFPDEEGLEFHPGEEEDEADEPLAKISPEEKDPIS